MGAEVPGSAGHAEALKTGLAETEFSDRITPETPVRMGSRLAAAVIDPRIKPGTRAYRATLLRNSPAEPGEPLEPGGEPNPDNPEGAQQPDTSDPNAGRPWAEMTGAEMDTYLEDNEIEKPKGWGGFKVDDKRAWLDGNRPASEAQEPAKADHPADATDAPTLGENPVADPSAEGATGEGTVPVPQPQPPSKGGKGGATGEGTTTK